MCKWDIPEVAWWHANLWVTGATLRAVNVGQSDSSWEKPEETQLKLQNAEGLMGHLV